jgi:hypothetical protein
LQVQGFALNGLSYIDSAYGPATTTNGSDVEGFQAKVKIQLLPDWKWPGDPAIELVEPRAADQLSL